MDHFPLFCQCLQKLPGLIWRSIWGPIFSSNCAVFGFKAVVGLYFPRHCICFQISFKFRIPLLSLHLDVFSYFLSSSYITLMSQVYMTSERGVLFPFLTFPHFVSCVVH